MKPIRIYARNTPEIPSSSYYLWTGGTTCRGGGGCRDDCAFLNEHHNRCIATNTMDQIVQTYRPSSGYIELTLDSHPEVFL